MDIETLPIVGHIQADAFCEGCGYNLHTQAVTRDERLGILICRCPECGRFAPAGSLTTARQTWLNRLGLGLLIVWILFLIFVFGMLTIFHGVVASGNTSAAVEFQPIASNPAASFQGYQYVLRHPPRDDDEAHRRRFEQLMIAFAAVLLGAVAGGVVSVCMWHLRDWRRLVAFVPALVGVGIAFMAWTNDPMTLVTRDVRDVAYGRMGFCLALEAAGVMLGLRLGRPFARAALTIVLPPKPRQHLAFLWTTDGKLLKL
jgi:hypothetical protein